jgi:competence protein ComEA
VAVRVIVYGRARWISVCVVLCVLCLSIVAKKKPPAHPINLNTASAAELQQVPGIGPSTADKILQMRKAYGAFKSVDDLRAVRGIGEKRLAKMKKYLTVGKPATVKKAGAAQAAGAPAKAPPKVPPTKAATKQTVPPVSASEDEEP